MGAPRAKMPSVMPQAIDLDKLGERVMQRVGEKEMGRQLENQMRLTQKMQVWEWAARSLPEDASEDQIAQRAREFWRFYAEEPATG